MGNKFVLTITAVDKASAIVRKINRTTSSITRPITNIGKSITTMGKEVKRNPIIQFTEKLGKTALGTAESIGKIVSPFSALLGGAASVGGIVALADAWGKSGIALEYASRRTGIAVGTLQQYRGAATAAGISANDMQSSLISLGRTLQDTEFYRNPGNVLILRRMGIEIHRNKKGVVDTTRFLGDMADYISKIKDPNVQAQAADMFGIGALLPMLQKGRQGMQDYLDQAKKAGVVNEAAAASNKLLGDSWNRMKLSLDGVSNTLSAKYSPALIHAIDDTTRLLKAVQDGSPWKAMKQLLLDRQRQAQNIGSSSLIPGVNLSASIMPGMGLIKYLGGPEATLLRRTATGKIRYSPGIFGPNGTYHEPKGIRHNNPMNLQPGGKESTFPTADAGIYAGARNLVKNYQGLTLAQIAHKYTPDGAPGNKPGTEAAWAAGVAKSTGMKTSDTPDLSNAKTLAPLLSAIIRHENGKNPYSKGQIEAAAQKVTVEVHVKGNTQGVTATARGETANVSPPRISFPFPTGATS